MKARRLAARGKDTPRRRVYVLAGGLDKQKAENLLKEGLIDLAAFGEPFIANPNLVVRLKNDWLITPADRS